MRLLSCFGDFPYYRYSDHDTYRGDVQYAAQTPTTNFHRDHVKLALRS